MVGLDMVSLGVTSLAATCVYIKRLYDRYQFRKGVEAYGASLPDESSDEDEKINEDIEEMQELFKQQKLSLSLEDVKKCPSSIRLEYIFNSDEEGKKTLFSQIERLQKDIDRICNFPAMLSTSDKKLIISYSREEQYREFYNFGEIYNQIGREELRRYQLPFILGVDQNNEIIVVDSADYPHWFIAGATGSGKSVLNNVYIATLLKTKTPQEVKFVFVDPKMVEYSDYEDLSKEYLFGGHKPSYDAYDTLKILTNVKKEMVRRNELFKNNKGIKKIEQYNDLMELNGTPENKLARIVIMLDEFPNIANTNKEIDAKEAKTLEAKLYKLVVSLGQMGRSAGIQLIITTQDPSATSLPKEIKGNVLGNICLKVLDWRQSEMAIKQRGGETLSGKGDLLLVSIKDSTDLKRIQSLFVSEEVLTMIIDETYKYEKQTQIEEKGESGIE